MAEVGIREGLAIVRISSERPEISSGNDRIAVMPGGTVVGERDRTGAIPEAIRELALEHRLPRCVQNGNTAYEESPENRVIKRGT